MNLILLTGDEIADDMTVTLSDRRSNHILQILKSKLGDRLKAGLVNGPQGTGTVVKIVGSTVTLSLELGLSNPEEPPFDLILALPRPIMLKRILFQASSLGIARIFLIRSRRVEKSFFEAGLLEPEQCTPILLEGIEQSGQTWLPQITIFKRFLPFIEDFMQEYAPDSPRLFADPEGGHSLAQLPLRLRGPRTIIAIGPEGGWVSFERKTFIEQQFYPITLGRNIFRVETAIAVLLGQLMLLRQLGDR